MKSLRVLSLLLILTSCARKVVTNPIAPPETFCQMLLRTEDIDCATLVASDNIVDTNGVVNTIMPPEAKLLYEAWNRGKQRILDQGYTVASNIKMGQALFYRPKLYMNIDPAKLYPLINMNQEGPGFTPIFVRGITSPEGPLLIQYAYEECVEHEAVHAIMRLIDQTRLRTQAAINDPLDADQVGYIYFFQIACHATSDDVFGDGPRGFRAGCARPWHGLPKS